MTLAAASLSLTGCAHVPLDPTIAAFEANLASHASATAALQQWCDQRAIAPGATITVQFVTGADIPVDGGQVAGHFLAGFNRV